MSDTTRFLDMRAGELADWDCSTAGGQGNQRTERCGIEEQGAEIQFGRAASLEHADVVRTGGSGDNLRQF